MRDIDIHKDYPKSVERDDFWGQIKRTVNGQPVSEKDIQKIINVIQSNLKLDKNRSHLLDLGCGNAALASYLFPRVKAYTGVDFSEYLIGVAKEFFSDPKVNEYVISDISGFLNAPHQKDHYTEVLCYGVMAYLSRTELDEMLQILADEYPSVKGVFVGNIPDLDKASDFYAKRKITDYDVNDYTSAIGVWWTKKNIGALALKAGWNFTISKMDSDFYASEYRFDLLLTR